MKWNGLLNAWMYFLRSNKIHYMCTFSNTLILYSIIHTYLYVPFFGRNSLNWRSVTGRPGIFVRYGNCSSQNENTTVVYVSGCGTAWSLPTLPLEPPLPPPPLRNVEPPDCDVSIITVFPEMPNLRNTPFIAETNYIKIYINIKIILSLIQI